MAGKNVGQDIDSKFDEAVDENLSGGGNDEEMDEFFEDAFSDVEQQGEGGVAEYDEDLGYAIEEGGEEGAGDEGGQEEEGGEAASGEEEGEEGAEAEGEGEEGSGEEEEPEEEIVAEGEEEEEEGGEEGEEEEEGVFYDGERDFGENAVPTQYKDRMSLNHGLVAKVSYFRDLNKRLEDAGTDLGALSLPKQTDGDPKSLEQFADIEQVMSMPDEKAKEMVYQMDSLLRNMKNKAERFEAKKEKEEEKQQITEEYARAQQDARAAVKVLGLDIEEGMTNQQIIDMAYDKLEAFENDEEQMDELSQKEFVDKLRDMEDAVFAIEDFAKVAVEQEKIRQQESEKDKKVTPEQIESAFKEFMQDQPNLDMVKNNRVEMQKSLIQTAVRKRWPLATPRDWLNNYRKFMKIVNANRTEKGLEKLKDDTKEGGDEKGTKKKKGDNNNGRAKKYANKKPSRAGGSVDYSNRTDKKEVDKLDEEIDRIAAQLTDGTVLDDQW